MIKLYPNPAEKGKKDFSSLSPKPNFEKIIFYLLVLLLPTQFGKHFWPSFSQVLGIRIDYLSPTLYATDLLILLLFLIWVKRYLSLFPSSFSTLNSSCRNWIPAYAGQLSTLISLPWLKRQKKQTPPFLPLSGEAHRFLPLIRGSQRGFLSLAWLIFFLYLFLNILFSNNPLLGLYGFIKILELFFLGYYVSENIKTKKELAIIALISSITVIGESLLAIAQYAHHGSINGLLYFLGERKFTSLTPGIANASIKGELILRPYGTFSHPNVLAGFLLCSLIFIFAFFEVKKDIKKKLLKIIALLLGSLALFLTLSRIAILLWFILVLTASANWLIKQIKIYKKSPVFFLGNIFFIAAIIISLFFFTPALPRLENTSFKEEAITQRADLFKSTLIMIKGHPLFGVGLYNFLPSLSHIQKPLPPTLYLQPVHNIFLLITAEIGIIGAAFFLWFLLNTYNRLLFYLSLRGRTELMRRSPLASSAERDKGVQLKPTKQSRSILLILSVILILGLFDHYWLTLQQGQLLFALVLGLCWAF